jgi:hypothetical protein
VVEPLPRQAPHPHLSEGPTASHRFHGMWMDGDGGDGDGGDRRDVDNGEQADAYEKGKNAGHP